MRSDGFFDQRGHEQASPAEEVLEGVLSTAADEWEQRKVPYIGRIFATLCFDAAVSPSEANYLLRLSERLTYQQVLLLSFWEAAQDADRPYKREVMSAGIRVAEGVSRPTGTILSEMNDLGSAGLLGVVASSGQVVPPTATVGGLGGFGTWGGEVDLTTMQLTEMGRTLYRLMGLENVPDAELEQVARSLHGS